jgi:hypothetical protein
VFQAFLTTFLIDSGYKTPNQTLDEMFNSGIKLAHGTSHTGFFDDNEETKASKRKGTFVNCLSSQVCIDWAKYQMNVSI